MERDVNKQNRGKCGKGLKDLHKDRQVNCGQDVIHQ